MTNHRPTKKRQRYPELTALKGIMREKKYSYLRMSKEMGIGITTLSDKINGFYPFDISEINDLLGILEIAPEDIARYFFPSMLRNAV